MNLFTFNDPPTLGLLPTFWMNGRRISTAMPAPWNPNGAAFRAETPPDAYVDTHKKLAIEAKWAGAGLMCFDREELKDLDTLRKCIAAAETICPTIPKMIYGLFVGEEQREHAIDLANNVVTPATTALDAKITAYLPVCRDINYINASVYMLRADFVDRDLAYIAACDTLRKRYFPHKPLILSVWSCYDTAWNPPGTVLAPDVTSRYVAAIKRHASMACVFDATAGRDDTFVSLFT